MFGETNFLHENTSLNGSDRQITHRGARKDGDEKPIVYSAGRRNLISYLFIFITGCPAQFTRMSTNFYGPKVNDMA